MRIHPSAFVDPTAVLADDVEVGAGAVVEAGVTVGSGSVLRPHSVLRRGTTLGKGNFVDSFALIGGDPQDLGFDRKTDTFTRVGDGNTFREGVTISRATKPGEATIIGDRTYWMANSHAAHDCVIGSDVVIVNAVLLAGHVVVGDRTVLAGATMVHQFTWIGEGVMTQGGSGTGMHLPPFVVLAGVNEVVGLNVVGMRRNPGVTAEDRKQLKEAFRITYRSNLSPAHALAAMDLAKDWGAPASRFRDFVRKVITAEKPRNRGLCPRRRGSDAGLEE